MPESLINFTQVTQTPAGPGRAMLGVLGQVVTVANADDTGIVKWTFTVIDVPPGSAVPVGLVQSGLSPSWSFTPDVRDCYSVNLITEDGTGALYTDTRVFGVPRTSGRIIPPFGADASSINFAGTTLGWDPILRVWLEYLDVAGATFGTDLVAIDATHQKVIGLQGKAINAAPTTAGQVPRYNGASIDMARLTLDDIDPAFTPTVSMASGGNGPIEIGGTWTPRLNGSPAPNAAGVSAYTTSDNQGGGPTSRLGTGNPFQAPASTYSLSVPGTVTISNSVTQNSVGPKATNTESCPFQTRLFGIGVITGAGATTITASGNNVTVSGGTASGTLNGALVSTPVGQSASPAPTSQKLLYACDHSTSAHVVHDANGDLVPFTRTVTSFDFVNQLGVHRTYDIYESDNLLTTLALPLTIVS